MFRRIVDNAEDAELLNELGVTFWEINELSQAGLIELAKERGGSAASGCVRRNIKTIIGKVTGLIEESVEIPDESVSAYLEYGVDADSAKLLTVMGCTFDSIARTNHLDLAPLYKGGKRQAETVHLFLSNVFSQLMGPQVVPPMEPQTMSARVKRAMESK